MDSSENLADEYAGKPDDFVVENAYASTHAGLSLDKENIEEHLEKNYRHAISLTDISQDDTSDLKAIYRQVKRLKYCVQNLSYKLAIFYKNYICSIRRDDSINCFAIKDYSRNNSKKMSVVTDLETLYEKGEKVIDDIQVIRQSIYKVLEKNHGVHGQVIEKIIENKKDISLIPIQSEMKRANYEARLQKLESMLQIMSDAEKGVLEKLYENKKEGENGLQNDINRVHQKAQLEKELDKINGIKAKISKNIFGIREKLENTILSVDKIMFDNTIMFDCMVKNFAKLKDFC